MKVCIVAPSPVPFAPGGAERLFAGLADAINDCDGCVAEVLKIPSPERDFADIVSSYRSFSRLNLDHFDLVVSTKYPSWMVSHPNHVVYMLHPLRGVYDAYHLFQMPTEPPEPLPECVRVLRRLLSSPHRRTMLETVLDQADRCVEELGVDHPDLGLPSPLLRLLVHWLDRVGLDRRAVRRHYAISRTVIGRAGYFPAGTCPRAVIPPSSMPISKRSARIERPFLFTASRLDSPKRIDMMVDAMRLVRSDVDLLIAGAGPEEEALKSRAAADSRIRFMGRLPEAELSQRYADATAVLFTPLDEDLGLITLEAHMSAVPVITFTDSGGPTELVEDGVSGIISSPSIVELARAMDELAGNPEVAARMGCAGRESASRITWEAVVDALLGFDEPVDPAVPARRRIVVLSTYPIEPAQGGGQLRCRHLLEPLGADRDVVFVCLAFPGEKASSRVVAPGVRQVVVPRSDDHVAAEAEIEAKAGIPVTDMAAAMLIEKTPAYLEELEVALDGADLAILAQPYLLPALRIVDPLMPFLYDSQNDEVAMKRELLPHTSAGLDLVDVVHAVESAAVAHGTVTVCSPTELDVYAGRSTVAPTLIPNGADVDGSTFTGPEERRSRLDGWRHHWLRSGGGSFVHLAIFVGSWHPPNLDAVEWILDAAGGSPDTLFLIAGSQCDYFRDRDLPDNVVMRGRVTKSELSLLLATADVALNPMRKGAGTNLKILEYFAAGVPVVATDVGARGIGAEPGRHYFSISDGSDLADAISAATDISGASAVVAAARSLVEEHYDWRLLGRRFADVVESCIARSTKPEDCSA